MKKALALILAALMVLAMIACGGESKPAANNQPAANNTTSTEPAKTEAEPAPAAKKSYQLVGRYEEEGANAGMLNAAFLLNLNEDGTAVADRYQFAQYNASPAAENPSYQASYLSGTWKEVEKDGVACLQIKLAYIDEAGNSSNDQTAYAYEIAGEYSFDLTFPIVPGMSYSRIAPMVGGETKVYADADAFIAANKLDFVEPESLVKFASDAASVYLQDGGAALLYVGTSKAAEGKWSADGELKIDLGGEPVAVTVDGAKASIAFSRDRGDGEMVDYTLTCDDISALASAAPAAAPAEDAPYTGDPIDLGGNPYDATLTLNDDGTATLSVAMGMNVLYTKVGDVVALTENPDAPLEGYGATIFSIVPHAWQVNDETKTMTALKDAFFFISEQAQISFYSADGENMTVALPAYGMSADGFTYSLSEDGTQLTVTAPADLGGGFAQVWERMNVSTLTVDGCLLH